jgi:ribosomal protein L11 methyltransferase
MIQQWQQIEFFINSDNYSSVEDFLFGNMACSVTEIKKENNLSFITVLYEDDCDVQIVILALQNTFSIIDNIEYKIIKDQEWTSAWLDDYEPVEIGENIVIYPSWRELPTDTSKTYIAVDPSVAFGCGNHETTKMCMEWIEQNSKPNVTLLDYGCGTGILAIAGAKLGLSYAEGVDIDEKSVQSSIENARVNNVSDITKFDFQASDTQFDLLVANIFSNVLISLADMMLSKLKKGGKIALSGILEDQVADVQQVFEDKGIVFAKHRNMGQWWFLNGVKK